MDLLRAKGVPYNNLLALRFWSILVECGVTMYSCWRCLINKILSIVYYQYELTGAKPTKTCRFICSYINKDIIMEYVFNGTWIWCSTRSWSNLASPELSTRSGPRCMHPSFSNIIYTSTRLKVNLYSSGTNLHFKRDKWHAYSWIPYIYTLLYYVCIFQWNIFTKK